MAGLGSRLRAGWQALLDAARFRPHQVDTPAADHRPRVRMPGPDAGAEGPPTEWLAYVLAQDPVWMSGGLGSPEPAFDDVRPLTTTDGEAAGSAGDIAAGQRPIQPGRPMRRPRARLLRPARPAERQGAPAPVDTTADSASATAVTPMDAPPTRPLGALTVRPARRLFPRHQPVGSVPAASDGVPSAAGPGSARDAVSVDRPPVWPTAVPAAAIRATPGTTTTSAATPSPAPTPGPALTPVTVSTAVTTGRTLATPSVVRRPDGVTTLAPPPPTPLVPRRVASRPNLPVGEPEQHLIIDPWSSTSSPGPAVELRRDLDDRPDPVDPPVAVRWRAIDVDRLRLEQRAV